MEGWIHYYFLPEDHCLSTVSLNVRSHTELALQEFLEMAQEKFRGYDLYLGYAKDNKEAVEFLERHGFACIEDSFNNTALLDQCPPVEGSGSVLRITRENFECFRALHDRAEEDMYWNSERIDADLDRWTILAKVQDGQAVGCVYYVRNNPEWFEIFGSDAQEGREDPLLVRDLLRQALSCAKQQGGKYRTFFCSGREVPAAEEAGFRKIGEYVCYEKHLS